MANDEIRHQKAMLILERTEAGEVLSSLREKAIRVGRAFQAFGYQMEHEPETVFDAARQGTQGYVGLNPILADQVQLLNLAEAFSLADRIRDATRKCDDLEQRRRAVGA